MIVATGPAISRRRFDGGRNAPARAVPLRFSTGISRFRLGRP